MARLMWLVVLGAACLVLAACSMPPQEQAPTIARVGAPAPPITLPVLGGGTADLAADRGKVVLVNFWATWCEPCKSEMPALQQLKDELNGQPFAMYSIDLQEDSEAIAAFQKQYGLNLHVLLDEDGAVTRTYGVRGLPATFVIDRGGVVRVQRLGPLLSGGPDTTWSEPWLAEQVRSLLGS
ncbi:MAG TPA: TlpA disulfide reductase family protein [Chloroflexota bacterium]|nr:TlpA disulfide reductase family protein [Chloroflexota bacterium]